MKSEFEKIIIALLFTGLMMSGCESGPGEDPNKQQPAPVEENPGIHVENGVLVDGEGVEFIPYGFNSVHVWLEEEAAIKALTESMPATGANTVRLVTSGESWTWNSQSQTPAQKRNLVNLAVSAGLVPMLEMHDATCLEECDRPAGDGKMGIEQIVDEWLKPDNLRMLKDFEGELMVNIANEWGPEDSVYFSCYKRAITRLREAGVKNVLVIDAGRCGQSANSLLDFGNALFAHDPLQNLVLSIHLYGFWRTEDKTFTDWTPPYLVEEVMPQLAALDAPVIVGEFGWRGEESSINYTPEKLLEVCKANGIGWMFWSWYDGGDKPFFNVVSTGDYSYTQEEDLTEAGNYLVNDTQYGMKNIAGKPKGF